MVGRARHSVHTAPNLEEKKPPSFFSKRRLSNLFRRSSVTSPSALMDTGAAIIGTRASAPAANLKTSFGAAEPSTSPLPPDAVTAIDQEMAFGGAKKYALRTSNGIRATNEDRFRIITSLELFGKALKATEKKRIKNYDDALTQRLMESYVNNHNAPLFDAEKLSESHKTAGDTEFYGVYDGHGGAKCSSLLALLLPLYLLRQTDFSSSIEGAAKRACLEINEEILAREAANQCEGGSTAITLLIRRGVAYFCNTGDCRAIIVSRKGVTALTTDHKAANELEKQRVEAAGGIVLYVHGIPRVNGRLAVARAFGDSELREVVIPMPDVTTHELTGEDEFIILASDGLWDALPNEQVLSCIRNHPWLDINDMAQLLIDRAIELGSTDNVTVLIVDVRKRP